MRNQKSPVRLAGVYAMPFGTAVGVVRHFLDGATLTKVVDGNLNKVRVEVIIAAVSISLI